MIVQTWHWAGSHPSSDWPWLRNVSTSYLLAKGEDYQGSHLSPIPMGEDVSDLSAILLDSDYYEFMMSGRKTREGLTWIAEDRLIPLKALAWLNLTRSKEAGADIRSGDIRKHLEDLVNLSVLFSPQMRFDGPLRISADLKEFIKRVTLDGNTNFTQVKERLMLAYGLEKINPTLDRPLKACSQGVF
jgi:hypothetical protein